MMTRISILLCSAVVLVAGNAAAQATKTPASSEVAQVLPEGDEISPIDVISFKLILKGEKLYQRKCAACHTHRP